MSMNQRHELSIRAQTDDVEHKHDKVDEIIGEEATGNDGAT